MATLVKYLEEQVHVEDITRNKNLDTKEDEDGNQEAGPSAGKKKTRKKLVAPRTPIKELTLSLFMVDYIGWGEPKYNLFYPRPEKCHAGKYTTL